MVVVLGYGYASCNAALEVPPHQRGRRSSSVEYIVEDLVVVDVLLGSTCNTRKAVLLLVR
jgi:hypothetical protein